MANTNRKTKNEKKDVRVEILTPYLSEGIEKFIEAGRNPFLEITGFGYDPVNFEGVASIHTGKHNVIIHAPEYTFDDGCRREIVESPEADFVIESSTEMGERETKRFIGSGLLIARYSIFYGKPSGYSGNMPENAGYSFDFPKVVGSVVAFLNDDNILEAILERNAGKIRSAVSEINKGHEDCPIIITPFLEQALRVQRNYKGGFDEESRSV